MARSSKKMFNYQSSEDCFGGQPDALIGFEQRLLEIDDPGSAATGSKPHAIVKCNGRNDSRVPGTVFESDTELAKADQYEPPDYKRISTRLASGKQAWVYADARFS
jgi:hypothetical protein